MLLEEPKLDFTIPGNLLVLRSPPSNGLSVEGARCAVVASKKRPAKRQKCGLALPALQEVTYMSESGEMNPQDTTYALEQCLEGCVAVHSLMVKTLKQ